MNDPKDSGDTRRRCPARATDAGSVLAVDAVTTTPDPSSNVLPSGISMTVPVPGQELFQADARRHRHMAAKRIFDIVLSLCALVILAPLLLLIGLAVKLTSRGPVLFMQLREGYNGRSFVILKFRSMHVNAGNRSGLPKATIDEPRATALGQLLRRTSVDELPQLINVLFGQMSLVGPRPHVPNMKAADIPYAELVPFYSRRLEMPPGLTGWAQANGFRGDTTSPLLARARVEHDIAYIQNFSFWLDLRILLLTFRREFFSGWAPTNIPTGRSD